MLLVGIFSLTPRSGVAEISDNVNAIQLHVTEDSSSAINANCGTCDGCYQLELNVCHDLARYPAANERSCVQKGGLWCAMSTDANDPSLVFFAHGGEMGDDTEGNPGLMHKDENCWDACNKEDGKCEWCGSGMCCRLGPSWTGGGCKGTIGSSQDHHLCVATPTTAPTTAPTPAPTTFWGRMQHHGRFYLRNAETQRCVHPQGGDAYQGRALIFHDGCDATRLQFEMIDAGSNGNFYLKNVEQKRCVHPQGGDAYQGKTLIFHDGCDAGPRLQFQMIDAGNYGRGRFYLKSAQTGTCVHPEGGDAHQGKALIFHDGCDAARLQFQMIDAGTGNLWLR